MPLQSCPPCFTNDQASQHEMQLHGGDAAPQQLLEGNEKGLFPQLGMGRPSEDGYNWRRFGPKYLTGSNYSRSYYKCTHPNCQVKKRVERSHDDQVTEIIYKGDHNHPTPQPAGIGLAFALNEMAERSEGLGSYVKVEGGSMWRSNQQGSNDGSGMDWNGDGLERTSYTSAVTEVSDPLATSQRKRLCLLGSAVNPQHYSVLASHDDEDSAAQGSIALGDEADEEESDPKRRAVQEPRVVIQTTSEVDIPDDGYCWTNNGKRESEENPNPRKHYICKNDGCSVRKHVERAADDPKSVITTYEGRHKHGVPADRNSSHRKYPSFSDRNHGTRTLQPSQAWISSPRSSSPVSKRPQTTQL